MLWLLASEYEDGMIPADLNRIAFRVRISIADLEDALNPLITSGFFIGYQDASNTIAPRLPREEEEKRKSKSKKKPSPPANADDLPCPHTKIIELYHECLPMLATVREWTDARQTLLRNRWKEKKERQDLGWWRDFFGYVAQSDFLCGRVDGRSGKPPFQADLEWLVRPSNLVKVVEGKYENRGVAA